jgi:gluconolactonase
MKAICLFLLALILYNAALAQPPKGEIVGPIQLNSTIYPGTVRNYWVYVPKQYAAATPACLMVVQDGLSRATGWKLPQVLDSLIAAGSVPVMIGVFVDPGTVPAARDGAFPRYNRSLEYDALGDRYAAFLATDLLPAVEKSYNISSDPDNRSIAGASSGAICAFNVAWERPDLFRRVLSTIGTYVGLRGGEEFATLVRKSEAKPIRVFLEDGNNDLNIYAGDWWTANQSMLSALTYAGYEVNHNWGTGGHDSKHAVVIMAEAMEWLWKDYPAKVTTHKGVKPRIDLLLEGEGWQEINLNGHAAHRLSPDKDGSVLFADKGTVYRIDQQLKIQPTQAAHVDLIAAGSSSWFGWIKDSRRLVSIDNTGKMNTLASHCDADDLCVAANGLYLSDKKGKRIGYYDFNKRTLRYFDTEFIPGAIALSAEKTFMTVAADDIPFGHSFKINTDGSIQYGQPYVHYHVPFGQQTFRVSGLDVDQENILYSATDLGVQVSDQAGRVNFIFSKTTQKIDDVKLIGDRLFVAGDGKLFFRTIAMKGIRSFDAPVTPPKPQL